MVEIAVVGLGSWGLCVLERIVRQARLSKGAVRVHVVEPGTPGGGVYDLRQPDYLVLNNPCGQLSLYATPGGEEEPNYAVGLYEWATRRGYRWVDGECRIGDGGRALVPTDFLPRRLMGEYLTWFYVSLLRAAPPNVEFSHYPARATDVVAEPCGRERVLLEGGGSVVVDHVVLTSGHTYNVEADRSQPGVRFARPYPVDYFVERVEPGGSLAVAGMGLVAFDILAALTIGRGGTFRLRGSRMRYRSNGREPVIFLYSRSGMPYCVKPAGVQDPTGDYEPVICTPARASAIRARSGGHGVDFRADMLPLVLGEMQVRYHTKAAHLRGGADAAREVTASLSRAFAAGDAAFGSALGDLGDRYGHFDPAAHLFAGQEAGYEHSKDYEQSVYDLVSADLDEALAGSAGSPVKAALEVTRILRDSIRSVVEFGALSHESYVDFQANIRPRINHVEAGPPLMRAQQLLALMDAGIVRVPFGPSPALATKPDGRVLIRSTRLAEPYDAAVTEVVRGRLDLPSLVNSASPLLRRLYERGRFQQLRYGDTAVGSIDISEDFHPIDMEGRVQPNISVLGVLTEGARYFTLHLPSPKSRLRAVLDAQACVESIIG